MRDSEEYMLHKYLAIIEQTAYYPGAGSPEGFKYSSLAFFSEVGELAGELKKIMRDDDGLPSLARVCAIAHELGDCYYYALAIARDLNLVSRFTNAFALANPQDVDSLAAIGRLAMHASNWVNRSPKSINDPIGVFVEILSYLQTIARSFDLAVGEVLRLNAFKVTERFNDRKKGK